MTDKVQPLDRRIFGSLKAKAKARAVRRHGRDSTFVQSLQAMMEVCTTMTEDEIMDAWDHLINDIERQKLEPSGE
jgi:hypothetical protein